MNSFMVSQNNSEHPADETLLAFLHEQPSDDAAAIRGHVAACAPCTARLRELQANDAVIGELLGALDHPLPEARPSFNERHAGKLRRAALIAGAAATMAAAAAAMVPSSPLHHWVVGSKSAAEPAQPATPTTPVGATQVAAGAAPLASGIAIPPVTSLVVAIRREQDSGVVEIARTIAGDVKFRSRGGTTAYEVTENQVAIDNQSPAAAYLIDLPASVRQVRIRIGTRTLIRWPEDSARFTLPNDASHARVEIHPPQ